MTRQSTLVRDPDSVLDFTTDWADWLQAGETIVSHSVAVETGDAVLDSDSATDTTVTAWISGDTVGALSQVRFRVTTSAGRTDDRTLTLLARQK